MVWTAGAEHPAEEEARLAALPEFAAVKADYDKARRSVARTSEEHGGTCIGILMLDGSRRPVSSPASTLFIILLVSMVLMRSFTQTTRSTLRHISTSSAALEPSTTPMRTCSH